MHKYKQYFFCFNQISFIVACELARKNPKLHKIIIMPNRIQKNQCDELNIVVYSPAFALLIFLISLVTRYVEVIIPHPKGGRLFRLMAKYSRNLSYIDDGMDTFRDVPKNIEISLVRKYSKYYTFNYCIPIAAWLNDFNVIPVCLIERLVNDVKPALNVEEIDTLVIESPGVNVGADFSRCGKVLFVRHPNYIKNQDTVVNGLSVSGLDYSLEKTLLKYKGRLIVGETMALVFALCSTPKVASINLYLNTSQYKNLSCLHSVLSERVMMSIGEG